MNILEKLRIKMTPHIKAKFTFFLFVTLVVYERRFSGPQQ